MLAVAAMTILAACSKENTGTTPNGVVNPDATTAYAKVSISMPKSLGTRAEDQFAAGELEESTITTIKLAFYDETGTYVGYGEPKDPSKFALSQKGTNASVEKDYETQIFVVKLNAADADPKKVVAFINTEIPSCSLTALENGYEFSDAVAESNKFVMTNAGYYASGNFKMAVDIDKTYIFDTEKDATDNQSEKTIEIYVERLAAKITLDKKPEIAKEANYHVYNVAGQEMSLDFTPQYWAPTGTAKSEFLVKTPFTSHKDESWTSGDHRSFWAEGVAYGFTFDKYYNDSKLADTNPLSYVTFNNVMEGENINLSKFGHAMGTSAYVREHTTGLGVKDENIIANTYAIVAGTYKVSLAEGNDETDVAGWYKDEGGSNIDFFLIATSQTTYTIYNKSQMIGHLLYLNGVESVSESNGDTDVTTYPTECEDNSLAFITGYLDLKYDAEKGRYCLAKVEDSSDLYDGEKKTAIDVEHLEKTTLMKNYHFENGAAYFNVLIQHYKDDSNKDKDVYGVVRNHSYVLTISKIENLGAPLNSEEHEDKDDPIIPDPSELKDHFINADIQVLGWHVIADDDVTL